MKIPFEFRKLCLICWLLVLGITAIGKPPHNSTLEFVEASHRQLTMLILIHSNAVADQAPEVKPNQQVWVKWPPSLTDFGSNQLLSILSGVDWQGSGYDLSFREVSGEAWISNNLAHLSDTGYFEARRKNLGPIEVDPVSDKVGMGSVNREALLLALDGSSDPMRPVPYSGPWNPQHLLVYESPNWADASAMMASVQDKGGRSVTLEIPDNRRMQWGRVWFSKSGWPTGFPIGNETSMAGLISAKEVGQLLLNPDQLKWSRAPGSHDSIAAWFEHVQEMGSGLLTCLALGLIFVMSASIFCVIVEKRSVIAAGALVAGMLIPVAYIATDNLCRRYGLEFWGLWFLGVGFGMLAAGFAIYGLTRGLFKGVHPLFWCSMLGLAVMLTMNPNWSVFSKVFSFNTWSAEGTAFGLMAVFLTGVISFSRKSSVWAVWFGRIVAVSAIGLACTELSWTSGNDLSFAAIPILVWLAAEGWFKWPLYIVFGLIPNSHSDVLHRGIIWAPVGCVETFSQVNGLNVGGTFMSLLSPSLLLLAMFIGGTFLFGDRFLIRQLRSVLQKDGRILPFIPVTIGLAVMGLVNPILLASSVICGFGFVLSTYFDAVWRT